MKHATVKLGNMVIPLIGVPVTSTQERCEGCNKNFHLSEITLDGDGRPHCRQCIYFKSAEYQEWCRLAGIDPNNKPAHDN
jgi:hypothetical protein